jgi:hypothetical protein
VFKRSKVSGVSSQVRKALRHIPPTGDLEEFVKAVGEMRWRPIQLVPAPSSPSASGLWIPLPRRDYVVFDETAAPERKRGIVCHELAHMLCGHEPQPGGEMLVQALAPSINPQVAARILARGHGYPDPIECEAETMGRLLATALAAAAAVPVDRVGRRLR